MLRSTRMPGGLSPKAGAGVSFSCASSGDYSTARTDCQDRLRDAPVLSSAPRLTVLIGRLLQPLSCSR
jgi:hypothetical protein